MLKLPDKYALNPATPQPSRQILQGVNTVEQQAGANLGQAVSQFGQAVMQERQNLAHAKLMNAAGEHELAIAKTRSDIEHKVEAGELPYQEAQKSFEESVKAIPVPSIPYADKTSSETYGLAIKQMQSKASLGMQDFVFKREQDDYKGQFVTFIDTQGKLAGLPGANVEEVNTRIDQTGSVLAKRAGVNEAQAAKYIQDAKDANWYNHANQKALASRNSVDGLKALETELTSADGFYTGKLDTPKRNALVSQVLTMRTQLENKLQIAADRQEIKAQRALLQMDQQTSTGVPAPAAQLQFWGQQVKGTPYEAEYKQRLVEAQEVQQVLRMPIDQQTAFVQRRIAELQTNGGDVHQIANANRLQSAVQANIKQLQETPLLYAQARTNETIEPIDFSLLSDPAGSEKAHALFSDRAATLGALRKQYGEQVQQRPLLPQEAQFLTATLAKATPQQQASMFQALNSALDDPEAYRGAMQQIAPDSPVKAMAGVLMGYSGQQTMNTHWISPDDKITAQKAATTMLVGESLINRTSADGKTDGKPVALPIPSAEKFTAEFQAEVGDVFAGRPQAFQIAEQAARAHYVGSSAETGDFSPEVDTQRMRDSIRATLGEPVQYKNNSILLPWGMNESDFRDQFQIQLGQQLRARGFNTQQVNAAIVNFPRMDVVNVGDGEYMVLDAARKPYIPDGNVVTVKVGQ
jgi:hypothetical protein